MQQLQNAFDAAFSGTATKRVRALFPTCRSSKRCARTFSTASTMHYELSSALAQETWQGSSQRSVTDST